MIGTFRDLPNHHENRPNENAKVVLIVQHSFLISYAIFHLSTELWSFEFRSGVLNFVWSFEFRSKVMNFEGEF
jgi:hypothetical protein